ALVGRLTITPPNFPDTPVGDKSIGNLTITNVGSAAVNISNRDVGGANSGDFQFFGVPLCTTMTISPGSSCVVSFIFAPTDLGRRTATFTITSDAVGSPQSVTLSGNGKGFAKVLSITPDPLSFPDTLVGGTGSVQTLTITNAGTATVNVGKLELGGA